MLRPSNFTSVRSWLSDQPREKIRPVHRARDAIFVFDPYSADVDNSPDVEADAFPFNLPPDNKAELRDNAVLMVQSDPGTRQKGPERIAASKAVLFVLEFRKILLVP